MGFKLTNSKNVKYTMKINQKKIEKIYGQFLTALGYDWQNDDNMKETPRRVVKMYLKEITKGVYEDEPRITVFDNNGLYDGIVFQGNINIKSLCSHHMMPFIGKAYIAYIPNKEGKIVGLSKLNRIADWYARRPQLQEVLTTQIHDHIERLVEDCKGVAVMLECNHTCVSLRGIEHDSTMMTTKLSGSFLDNNNKSREEFYSYINKIK